MSLYQKYRPSTLDQVAGNEQTVTQLRALLAKDDPPHVFLFTGPSGCGKTTLGRIVTRELGVADADFQEVDSADFRGIDTVRDMRRNAMYKAMRGERRAWLLDECFAAGTMVTTSPGYKARIETIQPGDVVESLAGSSRVLHTFKNVVPLHRIVRLKLSSGRIVFTTVDHLFLSRDGRWNRAASLVFNNLLFSLVDHIMLRTNYVRGYDEQAKGLSGVRRDICCVEARSNLLFAQLCSESGTKVKEAEIPGRQTLREVRSCVLRRDQSEVLLDSVRGDCARSGAREATDHTSLHCVRRAYQVLAGSESQPGDVQSCLRECAGCTQEDWADAVRVGSNEDVSCGCSPIGSDDSERRGDSQDALRSDENTQSIADARCRGEGESNEANQGHTSRLERRAGGQWEVDSSSADALTGSWMADGGGNSNWTLSERQKWISDMLQGRYWKYHSEDRDRSGWSESSIRAGEIVGSKEGWETYRVGVESIEIYQRGYNDANFRGVIGDRERNCGFAIFHDLEVENDPSYFAEGVAVHNCHKMSGDAQAALLKALEDPPSHVYYVLATTDPDKLLATVRGRCVTYSVRTLDDREMVRLLHKIASAEGERVDRPVLQAIAERAAGHARNAIQILEKVLASDPDARLTTVAESEEIRATTAKLVQALLGNRGWRAVASEIEKIKEDDLESVRRGVMGYCSRVLLGGDNLKAGEVLEEFSTPFFDTGLPGLVLACYRISNS